MVLFSPYKPRYQKKDWLFFLLLLLTQLKNLNPVSTTLSSMDLEILKPKGRMLLPNTTMVQGICMLQPLLAILVSLWWQTNIQRIYCSEWLIMITKPTVLMLCSENKEYCLDPRELIVFLFSIVKINGKLQQPSKDKTIKNSGPAGVKCSVTQQVSITVQVTFWQMEWAIWNEFWKSIGIIVEEEYLSPATEMVAMVYVAAVMVYV